MLRTLLLIFCVALVVGCGGNVTLRRVVHYPEQAAGRHGPLAPEPDPTRIPWFTGSLDEAQQLAARSRRPLLVYVWTTWCGPCKRLRDTTFRDPRAVRALAQRVVPVSLDGESEAGRTLCQRLRINSYPTFVFFRPGGGEIDRAFGFQTPGQLVRVVDDMLNDRNTVGDLSRRVAARPDDPGLRMQLGQQRALRGETGQALEHLEAVVALDPNDERGLVSRALFTIGRYVHRLKTRDHEAAAAAYEALLERFPASAYAAQGATDLATIYADGRKHEQALTALEKLVRGAPNDPARLLAAAAAAERLRLPQSLPIQWARTAAKHRKDGYPWLILSQLYEQAGQRSKQVEALREATRRSPSEARYRQALERVRNNAE